MTLTPGDFDGGVRVHLSMSVPLINENGREVEFIYENGAISVHPERWGDFRENFPALATIAEARA